MLSARRAGLLRDFTLTAGAGSAASTALDGFHAALPAAAAGSFPQGTAPRAAPGPAVPAVRAKGTGTAQRYGSAGGPPRAAAPPRRSQLTALRSAPLRSPGRVGSAGGRDCRPRAPVAPRSRPGPARLPDSSRSGLRRGGEPPCQRPAERPPAARHPGPRSSPAATRPALPDGRHGPAPPGRLSERGGRRRGHGTAAERGAGPGGAAPSPDWPGGESGYTWAAVRREPPRCLRPRDGRGGWRPSAAPAGAPRETPVWHSVTGTRVSPLSPGCNPRALLCYVSPQRKSDVIYALLQLTF